MVAKFTVLPVRLYTTAFFLFISLVEIPSVLDGGRGGAALQVFAGLLVFSGAWMAVRARSATVMATPTETVYRSLVRTRRWNWDQIQGFEVRLGRLGIMRYRRRILWVLLKNGDEHRLAELNESPRSKKVSMLNEARDRLKEELEQRS